MYGVTMFANDYLNRRLARVQADQEWVPECDGLWFLFVKSGEGRCSPSAQGQALAVGDVLVLNGGSGGKICAGGRAELVFWCFSLRLEHLYPLFGSLEIAQLKDVGEVLKSIRHYPASTPLAKECHRLIEDMPPPFKLDHRSQLLRVAAAVVGEEFKNVQRSRGGFVRIEEHIVQVFERLSAEDLLELSVGELATRFGCSRRHLNRLFHQYFGVSVAALRMEMRLLKAVALLKDSDAKVINVAEQCGFNHLGLFNNCFKKRFGASPGRWRKLMEEDGASVAGVSKKGGCRSHANGLCPWTGKPQGCNLALKI